MLKNSHKFGFEQYFSHDLPIAVKMGSISQKMPFYYILSGCTLYQNYLSWVMLLFDHLVR